MWQDTVWQRQPNQPLALQLAQRAVPALVYDAVNLEGVVMTLPEVQTLLDGITVGGHRLCDQQMALQQAQAWQRLFALVRAGTFQVHQATACQLHQIAARDEALAWGCFRTGAVSISGTEYVPPAPDQLASVWAVLQARVLTIPDVYDAAISLFLGMARAQFFWDVNKRLGRFMLNGLVLSAGFPVINVPARRQLTFNRLMLDFYTSGDESPMNQFLRACLDQRLLAEFV